MKTCLSNRWLQAGLASLFVTAGAGLTYGQTVLAQWTFNSSADVSGWGATLGSPTIAFLAGVAPSGQVLSSGSMEVSALYSPSATQSGVGEYFAGANYDSATELSFWIDPISGYDQYGQIQDLHPGLGISGWQYGPTTTITGAYNTWENIVIPIADINGGNWNPVNQILFNPYDGNYATPTTLVFAIDNIQIIAVPEPSTWAMLGLGVLALGLTACYRRKLAS